MALTVTADNSIDPEESQRLIQALLLGLKRQPLSPSAELAAKLSLLSEPRARELALFALLAQRQRFTARRATSEVLTPFDCGGSGHPHDSRSLLPEAARAPLSRLLTTPIEADNQLIAGVALEQLGKRGLRLHPFDLPRLAKALRSYPERLGANERTFLGLSSEAPTEEAIDAANWRDFGKAIRAAFLRDERRSDPAGARALVESCFKEEPAAVRLELIDAFEVGLSEADIPFLVTLERDRSTKVKERANSLLRSIPGSGAYQELLEFAAPLFRLKRPTLGRSQLEFKGAAKDLRHLRLSDLIERLELEPRSFIDRPPKIERDLGEDLLRSALRERRFDLADAIMQGIGEGFNWIDAAGALLIEANENDSAPLEWLNDELHAFLLGLAEQRAASLAELVAMIEPLYQLLHGPLPESIMAPLLEERDATAVLRECPYAPSLLLLTPESLRAPLVQLLARSEADPRGVAASYVELLSVLETHHSADQ